jgi:glycosyltransferase involved in cell wall biosynthesis
MFSDISRLIIFKRAGVFKIENKNNHFKIFHTVRKKAINFITRVIIPFLEILRILIINRVDLVHLNNSATVCWSWLLAARILNIPCVAHQRGDFRVNKNTIKQAKRFNRIICISKAIQKPFLLNRIENTKLIYNPIDIKRYTKQIIKERRLIRDEFNVDDSTPLIGLVGNFQEWKGQLIAIEAVKLLKAEFPSLVCLLVGAVPVHNREDKEYYSKIVKVIEELELQNSIIITGFRDDVPDLINAIDIQLHCSISPEPFGRVLIEGMSLKKPVIATNIGGPCEIIENGVSGLLIKPGDPLVLAESIRNIIKNENLRNSLANNGLERVKRKFEMELFSLKINKLYKELLS